jgi:hypothetical protein
MFAFGLWHQGGRIAAVPAVTALALMGVAVTVRSAVATPAQASPAKAERPTAPARPQGPCDIYAAGGTPCVAAHSTTRALYAAYTGRLYQVRRLSDGRTRDIGVVRSAGSAPSRDCARSSTAHQGTCSPIRATVEATTDQTARRPVPVGDRSLGRSVMPLMRSNRLSAEHVRVRSSRSKSHRLGRRGSSGRCVGSPTPRVRT